MTPTAIPETPTRSFPAVPALPSAKTLSRFGLGATRVLLGLLFAVTGVGLVVSMGVLGVVMRLTQAEVGGCRRAGSTG